ncbi:hypothetical protein [Nonomuraea sp. NPDC049758]|uniref:hypothetical protein n=1 Tax=Nonomuraea sp. NPDC049758 TaxID=3154360 RepID=UPI0034324253
MYGIGAAVRLTTEVRDTADVLVTPASIQVTILLPDGTTAGPYTPVSDGLGRYHYDYLTTAAGRHIARWATTTPTTNDEEPFEVAALWAEAGIFSRAAAKKHLNIDLDDHDDDEELDGFIRAVTDVCERHVGALGRRAYVEQHRGGRALVLAHPPVLEVTSVTAIAPGAVDQAVAALHVDGETGIVRRRDGGWISGPVDVAYVAGRLDMPANVDLAGKILLQHMWETQRGETIGVRVGGADQVWDPRLGYAIPRRALELLGRTYPGIA